MCKIKKGKRNMASIYEISAYNSGTFSKNDIVSYTSGGVTTFWYSLVNGSITSNPTLTNTSWGGYTTYNAKTIPHFFWIPSYAPSISSDPKVSVVKFGDGYEQRTKTSLNNDLIQLDLTFDKRDEKEATAIAHFLHVRGAQEAFAFLPPSPYSSMKKFICRNWDVSMTFDNNYTVKVKLEEVIE